MITASLSLLAILLLHSSWEAQSFTTTNYGRQGHYRSQENNSLRMSSTGVGHDRGTSSGTSLATESDAMADLNEVASLSVTVVVDNDCDSMTSGITGIDGFEYQPHSKKGGPEAQCVAGHGLSLVLTATTTNEEKHTILFDAGPSPDLWKRNAEKLNIDLGGVEAAVLSHYHYDHSGGLRGAVPAMVEAREKGRGIVVDLQSSQIVSRGRTAPDGSISMHKPDNPSAAEMRQVGAQVELHREEHTVCDNCFYVSGRVPRNTPYEEGIPGSVTLVNGKWEPDTDILDERYLAVKIKDRGLVVFSACSHSGINNVCQHAMQKSNMPIFGVVGGFHLGGRGVEGRIAPTVADLKDVVAPSIVLGGHCTGWRAKAALANAFPGNFQPLAVGSTYTFHS